MPLRPWRLPELEVGAASSGVASLDVTRRGRNRRGLGLAAGARGIVVASLSQLKLRLVQR
jgi:hypothetical protein